MAITSTLLLPATNTFEENVSMWAAHHHETTELGHGLFFDFSKVPELEKPCLDYLIKHYDWELEKPFLFESLDEKSQIQ